MAKRTRRWFSREFTEGAVAQLRKENKRLKEEADVMRKGKLAYG